MTRRVAQAALSVVALVVLASGCSGSSDGRPASTTAPTTTTTTKPEITDEEIIANINEKVGPSIEAAFDADKAACIMGVLEDGGTGKLDADEVVPAYQSRCGVSATDVTGVITAGALVQQGATKAQGDCVRLAVAKMTYDEVAAMGETEINQVYEACGIDPSALSGG